MTITTEIVADSISRDGIRLTTMALTYPRFIHAEFMTHRVFSRNASSSRAIPIAKSITAVLKDPAKPVRWGRNQRGMQAGRDLSGLNLSTTKLAWRGACYAAVGFAWIAMKAGAHKQIVNRILEPWSHITVLVTSTYWENFFHLRNHPDADPTIEELARQMEVAMMKSVPLLLESGQWHLPYVTAEDWAELQRLSSDADVISTHALQISAARSARVSYLTHSKRKPSFDMDFELYRRLALHDPMHASPLEHQATPDQRDTDEGWLNPELHGNFYGWIQHRKTLPNEAAVEHFKEAA